MPISSDILLDRIKLKSNLKRWRTLALLFAGLLLLSLVDGVFSFSSTDQGYVARVRIDGLILENHEQEKTLRRIAENEHIKAVIVHINTPGGTVVGGESLNQALEIIREQKPVVAVLGTMATSGGYMVAVASDHIFARKGTITGSIGVIMQMPQVTEMAKKLGIDVNIVKTSPLKGAPSPFEEMTPEVRRSLQVVLNDFYNVFIDMIVKGRKLNKQEVMALADGRVFTGSQALEKGLVDVIGGEEEARIWLEEHKDIDREMNVKDVKLVKEKRGVFTMVSSWLSEKNIVSQTLSMQGLLSIWQNTIH